MDFVSGVLWETMNSGCVCGKSMLERAADNEKIINQSIKLKKKKFNA